MEEEKAAREEMNQQKAMYQETLNNQVAMNSLSKSNFGKMTQQEKKLNHMDLHDFKGKNMNNLNSLIPGLNHGGSTIGVKPQPLKRGALRMMEFADEAGLNAGQKKGQIFLSANINKAYQRQKANSLQ